ncbi:hypothetical protein KCU62_g494, partial [Aureobasidium sp. EXF-3399]
MTSVTAEGTSTILNGQKSCLPIDGQVCCIFSWSDFVTHVAVLHFHSDNLALHLLERSVESHTLWGQGGLIDLDGKISPWCAVQVLVIWLLLWRTSFSAVFVCLPAEATNTTASSFRLGLLGRPCYEMYGCSPWCRCRVPKVSINQMRKVETLGMKLVPLFCWLSSLVSVHATPFQHSHLDFSIQGFAKDNPLGETTGGKGGPTTTVSTLPALRTVIAGTNPLTIQQIFARSQERRKIRRRRFAFSLTWNTVLISMTGRLIW